MSYFKQVTTTPRDVSGLGHTTLAGPTLPRQAAARARQAVGWDQNFYPKSGMGAYEATADVEILGIPLWVIALGAVGLYLYKKRSGGGRPSKSSGAGWYMIGRGEPGGRIKTYEGPFDTKSEAEAAARANDPPWYCSVSKRKSAPF